MKLSLLSESYFGNETIFVKYLPNKTQSFGRIPGYTSTLDYVLDENKVNYNEVNEWQRLLSDPKHEEQVNSVYGDHNDQHGRERLENKIDKYAVMQKQIGDAIHSSDGAYGAYLYQVHYDGPVMETPWDMDSMGWAGKPEVKIKPQDLVKIVSADTVEDGYEIYQNFGYPTFEAKKTKLPNGIMIGSVGDIRRFEGLIINNLPAHSMMSSETIINVPCRHTLIGVPDEEFGVISVDQIMSNIE